MMVKNLGSAGLDTAGIVSTPSLAKWTDFLADQGFKHGVKTSTMLAAYSSVLAPAEKDACERREMLDEIEEWEIIMSCYALISANNFE
jgi:hypothetical protein